MEPLHQTGELIAERYRIAHTLGQGGIGTTYEAEDIQSGKRVALKELSLRRLSDWKVLELFEREARVISHLNHPGIPVYIDYFQVDAAGDRCFYLVQEIAEGTSLSALVESGWRATEAEVRQLAVQILEILIYLHGLSPPVIHRDIKPENIIRRSDGFVFLVDFGAVTDTYRSTLAGGSTMVGTYGYMAPEQFRGQAFPATDLYGLGATLLFLLTHRSPADLPQHRLKIEFRSLLQISPDLADWLEMMLEPAVEDRLTSAKQALAILRGDGYASAKGLREMIYPLFSPYKKPAGSRIILKKTPSKIVVDIPKAGLQFENLFLAGFALIWNAFIFFWTTSAIASSAALIFVLFSLPFWAIGIIMFGNVLFEIAGSTHVEINRQIFLLKWTLLGFSRQVRGQIEDINRVELSSNLTVNDQPVMTCTLVEGVRSHRFGSSLTSVEKEWLVAELASFLGK